MLCDVTLGVSKSCMPFEGHAHASNATYVLVAGHLYSLNLDELAQRPRTPCCISLYTEHSKPCLACPQNRRGSCRPACSPATHRRPNLDLNLLPQPADGRAHSDGPARVERVRAARLRNETSITFTTGHACYELFPCLNKDRAYIPSRYPEVCRTARCIK